MPAPDPFATCLAVVLEEEGGYVNHPKDPGGITNLGVTADTWADWTNKPATIAVMKALTPAIVAPMYRARYWMPVGGDALPAGINLVTFDAAVNTGVGRAARLLQAFVGSAQDGHIGPATLMALQQKITALGAAEVVKRLMDGRRSYYRSRANFPTFGRGWLNRCDAIELAAQRMIGGK